MEYFNINSSKGNLIKGPLIIKPRILHDDRGYFFESWNHSKFNKIISREVQFVQDNHSESKLGVLRGLHYQVGPKAQAKLVSCINGKVFDVVADIRKDSETYGEWSSVVLSEQNKLQLWIPEGFVHGFLSLKDFSKVLYKTNKYWDKDYERSLFWKDSDLNINWHLANINKKCKIITSFKDSIAPTLKQIEESGDLF
tara:strand:+ start:85 stop:675 length:591 start_codon:yes stop_codon:yes gene_type:complete